MVEGHRDEPSVIKTIERKAREVRQQCGRGKLPRLHGVRLEGLLPFFLGTDERQHAG
jgi:hypothetical protein